MSLFVKHVADKQHFPFFPDAAVDIAMPIPCTASSHAISGKAFRWQTRSDHVTRQALAALNNGAYGQACNGRQSFRSPYSPSLSLKTLVTGILVLAVLTLEVDMDYPSKTSLCTVAPFPTDTPSPIFF